MLTEEREEEIRARGYGAAEFFCSCDYDVPELLAEIDRLRDELEQYTHTNQVQATVISELKAENERLQTFYDTHAQAELDKYEGKQG